MKVQTNAGEVELTVEMVCRGMVFQSDHWIQNHARDGALTMAHADPARPECWKATVDESWCYPVNAQRFLGCDPTIASRADCERYGVHGDAAAHGFARLRDGGAVDFEPDGGTPMPVGARVHDDTDGQRIVLPRTPYAARFLAERERFIGLDARHASPEDVRRLCCGAERLSNEQYDPHLCTLAIGDHDEHEDLATGVKWSARPNPLEHLRARAEALRVGPVSVALKTQEYQWVTIGGIAYREDARGNGSRVGGPYVHVGVDHARPGTEATVAVSAAMRMCGDSLAAVVESAKRAAESAYSDYFWSSEPSFGASALDIMAHQDESGVLGFCAFVAGLKRWAESPAGKRATQERALVALVAAVPEGLDPVGWRAAVLGTMEQLRKIDYDGAEIRWRLTDERPGKTGSVERLIREEVYSLPLRLYQRAITPAAPVDRVRATWKTRGPVLPCDNGEDE